jgi:proteasome component ECM29
VLQGLLSSLDLPPGSAAPSDMHSLAVRGFAYQALGQLAARLPHLFAGDVEVAGRFFDALAAEPPGLRATVQVGGWWEAGCCMRDV